MCAIAVLEEPETIKFAHDKYITQELYEKAAEEKPYALYFIFKLDI